MNPELNPELNPQNTDTSAEPNPELNPKPNPELNPKHADTGARKPSVGQMLLALLQGKLFEHPKRARFFIFLSSVVSSTVLLVMVLNDINIVLASALAGLTAALLANAGFDTINHNVD